MPDNNLHSINKLQDDIKAAKWLSVFLPKEKRQQIKELETSLANMIHLIESFNKYFSDAGWCAYVHVLLGKHADTGNVVRNQTAHAGDSAVLTSMYSAMRRS